MVNLVSSDGGKNHGSQFFVQKSCNNDIMVLTEEWQKVVDQDGTYFV